MDVVLELMLHLSTAMNWRGSGGKATTAAIAVGVAAAEVSSILYFMLTPWFVSPGDRSLYTSAGFNLILILLMVRLTEKHLPLRTWQDALMLSAYFTTIYISVQAPYLITWWNPMTFTYLIGPVGHTLAQTAAMSGALWYFKNKIK